MNHETLRAMKEACAKALGHRWRESALAPAYVVDLDNDHAVVTSFVEYNADGTVHLEFESGAVHQKFVAICNPANVSALIAEVERQAGEIERLQIIERAWNERFD